MAAKREMIEPTPGDRRYVRRDDDGSFKEVEDVGRSLAQDQKRQAKNDTNRSVRSRRPQEIAVFLKHRHSALMSHPFFTVGHSNRTADEFIGLLRAARIGMVVDVRRLPGSRTYPQFDSENLAQSLAQAQIKYELIVSLGGRRRKIEGVPAETNGAWRNRSFHNYADYALTGDFKAGFDQLLALGQEFRCAIMCSEAVWWRCHRRIIADHLLASGAEVFHLMGADRIERAVLTDGAIPHDDGSVTYGSAVQVGASKF